MTLKYRLAVFDADGTLFDSAPGIIASIRHTMVTLGLPEISEAQMRTHLGPPAELAYHRSFGLEGDALAEAVRIHREFNTRYGVTMCEAYPGIPELVDRLHDHGVMVAVASLKPSETLDKLVELQNIRFDAVHGYSLKGESKADLIRMCLEDLDVNPREAVMIGDTEMDRIGAEGADVDFIPVTYGYGFKEGQGAGSAEDLFRMIVRDV